MREEDDPFVSDELVEVDGAVCGVCLEIGGDGAQAETVAGVSNDVSTWGACRQGAYGAGRSSEDIFAGRRGGLGLFKAGERVIWWEMRG